MTDNEKIEELIERCLVNLLGSAGRVNEYRDREDFARNHTNYGRASMAADVLRMLGKKVNIDVAWDENEYLVVPQVSVDDRVTKFK